MSRKQPYQGQTVGGDGGGIGIGVGAATAF